jgi:hypothetical protein
MHELYSNTQKGGRCQVTLGSRSLEGGKAFWTEVETGGLWRNVIGRLRSGLHVHGVIVIVAAASLLRAYDHLQHDTSSQRAPIKTGCGAKRERLSQPTTRSGEVAPQKPLCGLCKPRVKTCPAVERIWSVPGRRRPARIVARLRLTQGCVVELKHMSVIAHLRTR